MSQYFVNDEELTSVANAIRTKSGGSNQLIYPQGFISELDEIDTGERVYTSSTGLLYTAKMTIDLGMGRSTGYALKDVMNRYGTMQYLVDLTLTGIVRVALSRDKSPLTSNDLYLFTSTTLPNLKKLYIQPTEVRYADGSAIPSDNTLRYNQFSFYERPFQGTNLKELVLGKVGGPFVPVMNQNFRKDMPVPPGSAVNNVGSLDGLTITVYTSAYNAKACFSLSALAPNTTYICRDYITGDILTS